LDWLERNEQINIEREKRISVLGEYNKMKEIVVDGYHDPSKTVIEFHGKIWHGCPTHMTDRTQKLPGSFYDTVQNAYERTLTKKSQIIAAEYNYRE